MIDVNQIRDANIALHGLTRADETYTFYYDETNNIRRLHVRADGLNVSDPKCFVIAGVAHRGPVRDLDLEALRGLLRIQKTTKEIKLEHVAKGDFLELLKARKIEIFLTWLLDTGLFIHFSALDPLYWSTVDIVDSILTEHGEKNLLMANRMLKNALYSVLRQNQEDTVELFRRYSYPDVGRERRRAFIAELRQRLDVRYQSLDDFSAMMLKGVLQIAEKLDALPYLEEEAPNVLIDGFGLFFIVRICLFKNSFHILDVEKVVEDYIGDQAFVDRDRTLNIYRFAMSHDEPGIQISDVIAGLLGKFFSMLQRNDIEDLSEVRRTLSPQQVRNLNLLRRLLDRSFEENPAFLNYVISEEDQKRGAFFMAE
ncbi:DUF3800 domain-containing protein [Tardiphaga sp.]|uniref:DUF3800 domain-containing protein n=1 Tax=Tardiphaga sp. TaxID=1926292 RepID=UPI0026115D9B|nr:DUF3800 domain-containing protein [Tardiphaga sp.]MDB5620401.1 hypothetical protein [Tardiphaga sp.]